MRSSIVLLCLLVSAVCVPAQEASYFYGGTEIHLTPDSQIVAATVHPSVSLEKYPRISRHFRSLFSSGTNPSSEIIVSTDLAAADTATAALAPAAKTKEVTPIPVYKLGSLRLVLQNEVIVQFKSSASQSESKDLLRKFSTLFVELHPDSGTYLLRVGNPDATLRVANTLRANRNVAFSEPNFLVIEPSPKVRKRWAAPKEASFSNLVAPTPAPVSDPYFPRQWGLLNQVQDPAFGKFGSDARVVKAWEITQGSGQISVAVLDDGVDVNHPDLKSSFATSSGSIVEWDAILDANTQTPSGPDSHGTHVAGVIAAQANNGIGIAGVAPKSKIIPIRIGTKVGSPAGRWTTPVIVDNAIRKAVDLKADVINGSWWLDPSDLVTQSITHASAVGRGGKGIVFVFAAGDDGGPILYPASLASPGSNLPVIAVGASDSWDQVQTSSSKDGEYWWASNIGPALSVIAPGVGIATTDLDQDVSPATGQYILNFSGTSSAAPIVSGVVALLLSVHPDWKASQVREQIESTADRQGQARTDSGGWGRVNACRALGGQDCN